MTRGNARELAVHLIYGRNFTGEEPNTVVETRLDKEYYNKLSAENDVYAERPSRAQRAYIDAVTSGVASREDQLNEIIYDIHKKLSGGREEIKIVYEELIDSNNY